MSHVPHRLRRAQGTSAHALDLLHHIGRVEVFARIRQGQQVDYAVVRGSLTAHGPTPELAIAALRAVIRQRQAIDQRVLDWQAGLDAGCTPEALTAFCQANDLDPAQPITLGELRRTVTKRRTANQAYARTLSRVGIHLSPAKK